MSPYRILGEHPHFESPEVLCAMVSINKVTSQRFIYIIQKTVPTDPNNLLTSKVVAHLQSGRRNSIILDSYEIIREYEDRRRYKVRHVDDRMILDGVELTQQDCLKLAMEDYCNRTGIEILETL